MRFDSPHWARPHATALRPTGEAGSGTDRAALAAIHDAYAPVMLALGIRILRDRQDAEDLVHDVLLEAWHRRAQFDPGRGNMRAWLLMRTRSRAIDRWRRKVRHRTTSELEEVPLTDPEDPHRTLEQARALHALDCLTADQRCVVAWVYFDGLTHEEVGARLGIPTGTVKSRMRAALQRLRRHLVGREEPRR